MAVVLFHSAEAWLIMASICGRLLLLGAVRLRFIWDFLDVTVSMTPGGCVGVHLIWPTFGIWPTFVAPRGSASLCRDSLRSQLQLSGQLPNTISVVVVFKTPSAYPLRPFVSMGFCVSLRRGASM